MAAIAGAAIAAGAMLHAQHNAQKAQGSATAQARQFEDDWRRIQLHESRQKYQVAVGDARKAGLHPLFALGAGMGQSPSFSPVSYPTTGSAAGSGIAAAGRAIQSGLNRNAQNKVIFAQEQRAEEMHTQAMRRADHLNWMDAMERASIMKRAEGNANTGPRMTPDGAIVVPAPYESSIERNPLPAHRPTRQEPNVNAPKWTTLIDKYGKKIKVYSETAQADELNQFLIYSQELFHMAGGVDKLLKKWRMSPTEAGKQVWKLYKRASKKTSQARTHQKGRASLRELRSNPNWR